MATLVGTDVVKELCTVLDGAFEVYDSHQDVGVTPDNTDEDSSELAACTAYISRSADQADEERFSAIVQARAEELRQSNDAEYSASLLQGAKAMLGYIYPDADLVQKDSLMEKFASSRGSSTQE